MVASREPHTSPDQSGHNNNCLILAGKLGRELVGKSQKRDISRQMNRLGSGRRSWMGRRWIWRNVKEKSSMEFEEKEMKWELDKKRAQKR